MKIIKKIYKKILFFVVAIYVVSMFVTQQQTLNTYQMEVAQYKKEIKDAEETKEALLKMKENINSSEYIEEIAREKLDMYLPNERVYIDVKK